MDISSIAHKLTDDPDIMAEGLIIGDESFTTKAMSMADEPIDQFLSWLDHNSLPLDPNTAEFQTTYEEYFGDKYDQQAFLGALRNSKQRRQLLVAIVKFLESATGSATPSEPSTKHNPGTIVMKRGTVIKADHVVLTQGGRGKHARNIQAAAAYRKVAASTGRPMPQPGAMGFTARVAKASSNVYILAGQKPLSQQRPVRGENNGHPDFWYIKPGARRGTARKFQAILSINPDNIKSINGMTVRDWWAKTSQT